MMRFSQVVVLLLYIHIIGATVVYTPNSYSYVSLTPYGFDASRVSSFAFKVMACNDAHVALTSNSGSLYEIVIGGWGNGQSVIRDRKQGSNLSTYRGGVISCSSYNYFWISWSGGTVRVGKGTSIGSNQIMSWYDSTPHSVDYVAVSTGWGATGRWEVVVNGGWSSWGGYGSCTKSCGSGTRTRYRSCNNPSPSGGGSSCSGSSSSSTSCNTHSCAINGGWSSWGSYGSCTKSCGSGTMSRSRYCNNPTPANGGAYCSGSGSSSTSCNTHNCPIDGGYTSWSSWGSCSKSCGGGTQSKSRSCTNPAPQYGGQSCSGSATASQACNTHNCPIHGVWGSWTSWGTCTVTCGGGTHTRSRLCDNPAPQYGGDSCPGVNNGIQDCNTHHCPIDGYWASWTSWSTCSVTCAGGTQSKTRTCSNPTPQYGGAYCSGSSIAGQTCNTQNCPIDGGWTSWSSWTSCPVTCGGGTQTRTRSCTNPTPQYQGVNCAGSTSSSQSCNTQHCPIDGEWTNWSSWDTCTVTCGGGTQGRTRTCTNPAPQYNGADCAGNASSIQDCNIQVCIIDGAWAQWSPWGSCSVTCGGGTYSRTRTCSDPAPANGGLNCTGDSADYGDCNTSPCPTVAAGTYQQLCPNGWFTCESGAISCIQSIFKCDCENDCDDGSDETEVYGQCPSYLLAGCKSHAASAEISRFALFISVAMAMVCSVLKM